MIDPEKVLDDIRAKSESRDIHLLINALESVLGRHSSRKNPIIDIFGTPVAWNDCLECAEYWPCRTVKDIIEELERHHG